jgi:TonB family protein
MNTSTRFKRWAIATFLLLITGVPARPDAAKEREKLSARIAEQIERSQLHKIYVADFLDLSGNRNQEGCYYASVLSGLLAKRSKKFEVVNRINAYKTLRQSGLDSVNLAAPDPRAKAIASLGADALLFGTLKFDGRHMRLDLFIHSVLNENEVNLPQYEEEIPPEFGGFFPAAMDSANQLYYFSGLDGTTAPRCIHCPQPNYPDEVRKRRLQGTSVLSALVLPDGTTDKVRIVRSLDSELDALALGAIKTWKLKPAEDPSGNPIPVRVPIEINFKLF